MIGDDIVALSKIINDLASDGNNRDVSFSIKNGRIPSVEVKSLHVLGRDEVQKLIDGFLEKKKTGQIAVNSFKGGITTVGVKKTIKL